MTRRAAVRRVLIGELAFMALQAFGGGAYGLAGAEGVPREWLAGSPFHDYFVPSLILITAVGGSCLLAAIAMLFRWRHAAVLTASAGAVMLGWIGTQVAIIGYVSWLQPAVAIVAMTIVTLTALDHRHP